MTYCCWCWEPEQTNIVDDIIVISEDGTSHPKTFITEYIRINSTTFFIHKKSPDGKVQLIITFYDFSGKPQFVRGFLYICGKEYAIKSYSNDTFSLYT